MKNDYRICSGMIHTCETCSGDYRSFLRWSRVWWPHKWFLYQ